MNNDEIADTDGREPTKPEIQSAPAFAWSGIGTSAEIPKLVSLQSKTRNIHAQMITMLQSGDIDLN